MRHQRHGRQRRSARWTTLLVGMALIASLAAATAEPVAADDDPRETGYWQLAWTETNPDGASPERDYLSVSISSGSMTLHDSRAPRARAEIRYEPPPAMVLTGEIVTIDAEVSAELLTQDAQLFRYFSVRPLPGGRADHQVIQVGVSCKHEMMGPDFECIERARATDTFRISPPSGRPGDRWHLGMQAGGCGDACTTWYVYDFVGPDGRGRYRLCDEAHGRWGAQREALAEQGIDLDHTGLHIDGDLLLHQFRSAVTRYESDHPDQPAFVRYEWPYLSTLFALQWLFASGGVRDEISVRYVDGREADLRAAIIDASEQRRATGADHRLQPGDVFELALRTTDGDVTQAMLLAHNTLRSLGRHGDAGYTGLGQDAAFFTEYLVELRDEEDIGPWYHMFGTAYFSLVAAGDIGDRVISIGAGVGLAAAWGLDAFAPGVGTVLAALGGAGHAALSRASVVNYLEQEYREKLSDPPRRPDPEKYCFNVWGFAIGEALWSRSLSAGPAALNDPIDLLFHVGRSTPPILQDVGLSLIQLLRDAGAYIGDGIVSMTSSPLSMWWQVDEHVLAFEQGATLDDAEMWGWAPVAALPIPMEDGTWAVLWITPETEPIEVTFEVTRDDVPSYLLRVDESTGEVAMWDIPATHRGDLFAITLDQEVLAPPMRTADGSTITPIVLGPSTGEDAPRGPIMVLLVVFGVLSIVALAATTRLVSTRRRSR